MIAKKENKYPAIGASGMTLSGQTVDYNGVLNSVFQKRVEWPMEC